MLDWRPNCSVMETCTSENKKDEEKRGDTMLQRIEEAQPSVPISLRHTIFYHLDATRRFIEMMFPPRRMLKSASHVFVVPFQR
jgi:hypothetical protein